MFTHSKYKLAYSYMINTSHTHTHKRDLRSQTMRTLSKYNGTHKRTYREKFSTEKNLVQKKISWNFKQSNLEKEEGPPHNCVQQHE